MHYDLYLSGRFTPVIQIPGLQRDPQPGLNVRASVCVCVSYSNMNMSIPNRLSFKSNTSITSNILHSRLQSHIISFAYKLN